MLGLCQSEHRSTLLQQQCSRARIVARNHSWMDSLSRCYCILSSIAPVNRSAFFKRFDRLAHALSADEASDFSASPAPPRVEQIAPRSAPIGEKKKGGEEERRLESTAATSMIDPSAGASVPPLPSDTTRRVRSKLDFSDDSAHPLIVRSNSERRRAVTLPIILDDDDSYIPMSDPPFDAYLAPPLFPLAIPSPAPDPTFTTQHSASMNFPSAMETEGGMEVEMDVRPVAPLSQPPDPSFEVPVHPPSIPPESPAPAMTLSAHILSQTPPSFVTAPSQPPAQSPPAAVTVLPMPTFSSQEQSLMASSMESEPQQQQPSILPAVVVTSSPTCTGASGTVSSMAASSLPEVELPSQLFGLGSSVRPHAGMLSQRRSSQAYATSLPPVASQIGSIPYASSQQLLTPSGDVAALPAEPAALLIPLEYDAWKMMHPMVFDHDAGVYGHLHPHPDYSDLVARLDVSARDWLMRIERILKDLIQWRRSVVQFTQVSWLHLLLLRDELSPTLLPPVHAAPPSKLPDASTVKSPLSLLALARSAPPTSSIPGVPSSLWEWMRSYQFDSGGAVSSTRTSAASSNVRLPPLPFPLPLPIASSDSNGLNWSQPVLAVR
jgi:hypothetical protein